MATQAKTNGQAKKEMTTTQPAVQKQLAAEAAAQTGKQRPEPGISLDERIDNFEKLRGLANQRERVTEILTELSRFNYNSDDSCTFFLRDIAGLEFKTTNTNLIKMVATELQRILETKKAELEQQIVTFKL